jgi:hypothetical protein
VTRELPQVQDFVAVRTESGARLVGQVTFVYPGTSHFLLLHVGDKSPTKIRPHAGDNWEYVGFPENNTAENKADNAENNKADNTAKGQEHMPEHITRRVIVTYSAVIAGASSDGQALDLAIAQLKTEPIKANLDRESEKAGFPLYFRGSVKVENGTVERR